MEQPTSHPAAVAAAVAESPGAPQPAPREPWRALNWLFLAPRRFFRSVTLDAGNFWLAAIWLEGITSVMNRIDQKLLGAEFGRTSGVDFATSSWLRYFGFVLVAGVFAGAISWWLWGWWYKIRVRWSGADDPDPRRARLVFVTSAFVLTAPMLLYTAVLPFFYPDYRTAYVEETGWSLLLVAFVVWSVIVSYHGVLASFEVVRWRARLWFLILPLAVYAIILGAFGVVLGILEST